MAFKFHKVATKIPIRYRLSGDIEAGRALVHLARNRQYDLIRDMGFQGLKQLKRQPLKLNNGGIIQNTSCFGLNIVTIHVPLPISTVIIEQPKECFCYCKVSVGIITAAPAGSEKTEIINGEPVLVPDLDWIPQATDVYTVEVCNGEVYDIYSGVVRTDFYPHYKGDTVLMLAQDYKPSVPEDIVLYKDIPECRWDLWRITSMSCPEALTTVAYIYGDPPQNRRRTSFDTSEFCCHKATITAIDCTEGTGYVDVEWEDPGLSTHITECVYERGMFFTHKIDTPPYLSGLRNNPWMAFAVDDVVLIIEDVFGALTLVAHSTNENDHDPIIMDGGGTEAFLPIAVPPYTAGPRQRTMIIRDNWLRQIYLHGPVIDLVDNSFDTPYWQYFSTYTSGIYAQVNNHHVNYLVGLLTTIGGLMSLTGNRLGARFTLYFEVNIQYPRQWGRVDEGLVTILREWNQRTWAPSLSNPACEFYRPAFATSAIWGGGYDEHGQYEQYNPETLCIYIVMAVQWSATTNPIYSGEEGKSVVLGLIKNTDEDGNPYWEEDVLMLVDTETNYVDRSYDTEFLAGHSPWHYYHYSRSGHDNSVEDSLIATIGDASLRYFTNRNAPYSYTVEMQSSVPADPGFYTMVGTFDITTTMGFKYIDEEGIEHLLCEGTSEVSGEWDIDQSGSAPAWPLYTYSGDFTNYFLTYVNLSHKVFIYKKRTCTITNNTGDTGYEFGTFDVTLYLWYNGTEYELETGGSEIRHVETIIKEMNLYNEYYNTTINFLDRGPSSTALETKGMVERKNVSVLSTDDRILRIRPTRLQRDESRDYEDPLRYCWDILIVDGVLITQEYAPETFTDIPI